MQSNKLPAPHDDRLRIWLQLLEEGLGRGGRWAGYLALAMALFTGEWLTLADGREGLISVPALRALHVLAGLVLLLVLLARLVNLGAAAGRHLLRHRGLARGALSGLATLPTLLSAAFWASLVLLLLSGVERTLQLRYGVQALPGLSPLVWGALHWALLPFLYVFLLLLVVNWGKVALKRALEYLYTP
jgi:hypothetical protein